jgi:hypothetical protein
MHAKKWKQAGWTGLCVLIVSGCASANPAQPPVPAQSFLLAGGGTAGAGSDLDSSFDNLDVVDSSLNGKIAVLRVGSEVAENNLLSIFAGLKNKTARRLDLEVQTIYKDKDDNALNAGSWISFTLKPHEEKEYHSTSISVEAVDFLVRVRRASSAAASIHQ